MLKLKNNRHPVYIVQGSQFGSEGKGQIVPLVMKRHGAKVVIRTGSINAGHTVHYQGKAHKMQLIPTGWVNPEAVLVLGPGCYIHRETLEKEATLVSEITGKDIRNRLLIDENCPIHSAADTLAAQKADRHHAMGATGKGSSESIKSHLDGREWAKPDNPQLFRTRPTTPNWDFKSCLADTPAWVYDNLRVSPVVIEGTQGAELDLYTGPYPFVTNRSTSTAAWLAAAGLSPTLDVRPILVTRTMPIRVAGNSGPMVGETTWPDLYRELERRNPSLMFPVIESNTWEDFEERLASFMSSRYGAKIPVNELDPMLRWANRVALSEVPTSAFRFMGEDQQAELAQFMEMTTVTKKIRRIAHLDTQAIKQVIARNGCDYMWLTFLNYWFPEIWGSTDVAEVLQVAGSRIQALEETLGVKVLGVTTGPLPCHHLNLDGHE